MPKRQDLPHKLFANHKWLLLILILLLGFSACQPMDTAPENELPTNQTIAGETVSPQNAPTRTPPDTPPDPLTTTPSPDCLVEGGSLQSETIFSERLDADFHFQIYLPHCYPFRTDQPYPVIYLLHGLFNDNEQWLRLGLLEKMNALIADGIIPPFIVVLPQEDVFKPHQTSLFADALAEELIPWVDAHYETQTDRKYRGIGGISRGAAWAVRIGFTHFNTFRRVGVHSLPEFEADTGRINSWITSIPREDLPTFFIDIGRDDPDWQSAQAFANQLNDNNVPHEWYLFKGGHTETYWTNHLEQYLLWYAKNW